VIRRTVTADREGLICIMQESRAYKRACFAI